MNGKNVKNNNGDFKKRIAPALLSSMALALTVLFFGPFELYANNMAEFAFELWDFFGVFIAIAVAVIAALTLVLIWLPKRVFNVACTVISIIALMLYVQGTFLTMGMNSVEGDGVDGATVSTIKLLINTAVWIIVVGGGIAAAVIFSKKHTDIIRTVLTVAMVTVIGMQAVSFATVALTTEGVWGNDGTDEEEKHDLVEALTYKNMEKVSTDSNIVYFVVDRFATS